MINAPQFDDWRSWTREQQVILFVVGILDELKAKGFVEGGQFQLSEKARPVYEDMEASGFEATQEEIAMALDVLQNMNRTMH